MKNPKLIFGAFLVLFLLFNLVQIFSIQQNENYISKISEIEIAGSSIDWNCETHQSGIEYDPPAGWTCPACGQYHPNVYEIYTCDNGLLTWCYPGYIEHINGCDGYIGTIDNTYMSGCE